MKGEGLILSVVRLSDNKIFGITDTAMVKGEYKGEIGSIYMDSNKNIKLYINDPAHNDRTWYYINELD